MIVAQFALGTLEWDRVNGRAIASEAIVELLVDEGDTVARGQPLLRLDDGLQQSRVLQTRARIEQLGWRLQELQAGYRAEQVAAAEAEHDAAVSTRRNAELEYQRQARLFEQKLTSQRAVESARTRLDEAVGKEEALLENLKEFQAGFRTEQVAQAEAELASARAELAYQEELLQRYTVLAERDGVLESFPFKLGDKPPAGAVVSTILSGERPWARVYLPEPWLGTLAVGSEVEVFVDAGGGAMRGRLRHIQSRPTFTPYFALAEEDRQRLTYVSEIDLLDERARELPVGVPVQVAPRTAP